MNIVTVTLGPTPGSDVIVTTGIKAGDKIVVEGVQKVKQGEVVAPSPYVETAQEKSPDIGAMPSATPAAKD